MRLSRRLISYLVLLVILVAELVIGAILEAGSWSSRLNNALLVLVLTAGAWAATDHHRGRTLLVALALMTSGGVALAREGSVEQVITLALLSAIGLLATVQVLILRDVLRTAHVGMETIAGGLCVYLIAGTAFGLVYLTLENYAPGSFRGIDAAGPSDGWSTYFSLVTLSTLGYGDIVPSTRVARTLAAVEAIGGQLYVAVLIGRLVGLHVGTTTQKKDENQR